MYFTSRLVSLLVLLVTVQVGAFASMSPSTQAKFQQTNSNNLRSIIHDKGQQRASILLTSSNNKRSSTTTSLNLAGFPRGGAAKVAAKAAEVAGPSILSKLSQWNSSPNALFNSSLMALALATAIFKIAQQRDAASKKSDASTTASKPSSIVSLQRKFLAVFWLLRCADWLQGPYFYEVYASKIFNGAQASMSLVSQLFLTGFASTALFGPLVGRATDNYGRKKGTLAFSIVYALGAISTKSPLLKVLLLGRVLSGIGTSLLFSAPESWLVGEAQKSGDDPEGKYLGETFGLVRVSTDSISFA